MDHPMPRVGPRDGVPAAAPRGRAAGPRTPALGALMGLAWYVQSVGGHTMNPTQLGWLSSGDSAAHLLGWLFFRSEPWTFPPGTITGLLYPVGTTLGFTDANPWVSLVLKPFSPWLPADFQFIGLWLALCFTLQGVFGATIMERLTPHPLHRILGTALFVLAPPILLRTGHDTLCAQWLVLALVWLHLRPVATPRRTVLLAFAFNGLAAGTHPYLAAMLAPLTVALFVRMWWERPGLTWRAAALASGGLLVQTTAIFVLLGYFAPSVTQGGGGFGVYSADLLTFVNAMGHSRWMPTLPSGPGQYEGFAFLGSGAILLAIAGLALRARPGRWPQLDRRYWPLVAAAGLMGVFALSHTVTVAGHVVLTLRSAYDPFAQVVAPFRASGRFIWPLFYVVLTGILVLVVGGGAAARRARATSALLLMAVVIQAGEVTGVWPGARVPSTPWASLSSPAWEALGAPYRHLVLYPPFQVPAAEEPICEWSALPYSEVVRLSHRAYRSGMTVNSGYVARTSLASVATYCRQLRADVHTGRFADDTVYVVAGGSLDLFAGQPGLICGTLDGFHVCAPGVAHAFRDALSQAGLAAGASEAAGAPGTGAPPAEVDAAR